MRYPVTVLGLIAILILTTAASVALGVTWTP